MREIIFRGKRIDSGEWTYGYFYCHKGLKFYSILPIDETPFYNGIPIVPKVLSEYEVYPETVGQYTGLCDKNGTKIFEGDIIKYFENNSGFEIKFNRIGYDSGVGLTGFVCVDDKRYCKEVDYDTKEEFYICDRCVDLKQVEVIGNIYDNPELLEE